MDFTDVEEVLGTIEAKVREQGIPVSIAAAIEYIDPEDGQIYLWVHRDTKTPIWHHLGMAMSMSDDFRSMLRGSMGDAEEE